MGFSTDDAHNFRVTDTFQLADVDPSSTPGFDGDGDDLEKQLHQHDKELEDLQENLWATRSAPDAPPRSLLIVLQGMDTAGKGGVVKRLFDVFNPLGTRLATFGAPTKQERSHDFLWRVEKQVPSRGEIVIFDRSHYEDVLIQRVERMADPAEIERRYGAIVDFENRLAAGGTRIIKVMLHISRDFQKENLIERLTEKDKHWKYDPSDIDARAKWSEYQAAYQIAMSRTSTGTAPWYCIPGDNKDFARMVVKHLAVDVLRDLESEWPPLPEGIESEAELERLKRS